MTAPTYAPPLPDEWALLLRRFRDGQVAPRDLDEMRELAKAGMCPFCARGPYKSPVGHSVRAHGIDRFQFRELLCVTWGERFLDPVVSAKRSELSRQQYVNHGGRERLKSKGGTRTFSAAGMAVQMAKLTEARKAQQASGNIHDPLPPALQRRLVDASVAATRRRMEPLWRLAVETYDTIVAERGMTYGAANETAEVLGWEQNTTNHRLNAAWDAGFGVRHPRATSEVRACPICSTAWTAIRGVNWAAKTCSASCGRELTSRRQRKPPREAICMVCGETFTYSRRGSRPRTLCDRTECRGELSRRTQTGRVWSEESRRRLSEAKRSGGAVSA